MTLAWIVYSIAIAAILGFSAFSLEYGLRRRGVPLRWVWLAAMCGTLTLSSIPWIRSSTIAVSAEKEAEPQVLTISESATRRQESNAALSLSSVMAAAVSRSGIRGSAIIERVEQYFLHAWILASLGVAVYLGTAHRMLSRRRRRWRETTLDGRPVLISKDVGPAVVGLIHPAIVLPEWILDLSSEQRKLILAHETEHTQAGDHALLGLASLCLVIMPWNAPLWWHVRRLRHAVEIDCDERVLRGTNDATAYGELLVDVGERASLRWLGVAAFGDSSSFLAGRIRNIVAPRPPAWRLFAGAGICAVGLLIVGACEMPPTTLGSRDEAATSEDGSTKDEVPAVTEAYSGPGDPSLVGGTGRDGQSVAPNGLEIVKAGRPNGQNVRALWEHLRPENELDDDQAVWVAVDARGGIRKSWVGPKLIFDEGTAYEAHLRQKTALLQQNIPDLQIRSEIFLGLMRIVSEAPGKPSLYGINLIQDLVVHVDEPMTN